MKAKLEILLEKNCRYLEFKLRNGSSYVIYEPNKEGSNNTFEILDDGFVKWVQHISDGCIYERYFAVEDIIFVTGTYNCPEGLYGTMDGEEVDESV